MRILCYFNRDTIPGVLFWAAALILITLMVLLSTGPGISPVIFLACLVAGLVAIPAFKKFAIFFPLILALRSSLDIFTDIGIPLAGMKLNIPSLLGIFIIISGGIYLLSKRRVGFPTIAFIYSIWLTSLIPFIFVGIFHFGLTGIMGVREWIRLFTVFMVFILTFNLVNETNQRKYLNLIFCSLIIPLAVGYYQIVFQQGAISGLTVHRIYGTLSRPSHYSYYLVLFAALTYWKFRTTRKWRWLVLLIIELIALMATVCLTGYLMLAALIICLLFTEKKGRQVAVILIVLILAVVLFMSPNFQKRWEKMREVDVTKVLKEKRSTESFTWRILNWYYLVSVWEERPYCGYGLQTTVLVNPMKTGTGSGYVAHGDIIAYLVETGVVGLFLYGIFVLSIGGLILREYLFSQDPRKKSFLWMIFSIYVAWQVGSLAGNIITATAFHFYFWALLALALKSRSPGVIAPCINNKDNLIGRIEEKSNC